MEATLTMQFTEVSMRRSTTFIECILTMICKKFVAQIIQSVDIAVSTREYFLFAEKFPCVPINYYPPKLPITSYFFLEI